MNISRRIKFNNLKSKFSKQTRNLLYFIFKPLTKLEDKIYKSKNNKLKSKAKSLTDEEVINIIAKNIIKKLSKNCNSFECFDLNNGLDNYTILDFARNIKNNKVLKAWSHDRIFNERDNTIQELTGKLKENLEQYPEINCYYYQRNKYCDKTFNIELKEIKEFEK